MAEQRVTASIVVQFGERSDAVLVAELDQDKNGGKTSFAPGDAVWFRVYADTGYSVHQSSGNTAQSGGGTSDETEQLVFAFEDTARVAKPIKALGAATWYGASPGSVTKLGTNQVRIPKNDKPYVGKLEYKADYDSWKLTPPTIPAGQEYAIVVVVVAN